MSPKKLTLTKLKSFRSEFPGLADHVSLLCLLLTAVDLPANQVTHFPHTKLRQDRYSPSSALISSQEIHRSMCTFPSCKPQPITPTVHKSRHHLPTNPHLHTLQVTKLTNSCPPPLEMPAVGPQGPSSTRGFPSRTVVVQ